MTNAEVPKVWTSEVGLPCIIVRHSTLGHLCGYVGVLRGHPWYEKNYNDCVLSDAKPRGERENDAAPLSGTSLTLKRMPGYHRIIKTLCCVEEWCDHKLEAQISVHGGITYSGWGFDPMPRAGEWWFGFDCAHVGDLVPGLSRLAGSVFRDEAYVTDECESMARQLAEIQKPKKANARARAKRR